MYGFGEYLNTPGAVQPGPGTRLIEHWGGHTGFGDYVPTDNYFLTPAGQAGIRGLGCGCAGMAGCNCGMGLFDAGMDVTQWGVGEWLTVALGSYVILSLAGDMGRGKAAVKRATRRRTKRYPVAA